MLKKEKIVELFQRLNAELEAEDIKGEVGIVGGAVMCLVYDARPSTKDVDAIFAPSAKIRELAAKLASEEGLDDDWLNDGAKGFMEGDFERLQIMNFSNLIVWAPEPRYMLAMKCMSARVDTNDADDIKFLINHLGLRSAQSVLDVVENFYPAKRISAKTKFFVEEFFSERQR